MTDWLQFRVWVFWQPFWTVLLDFRLQFSEVRRFQLSIPNTQFWFNNGPLSATLTSNWNIGWMYCIINPKGWSQSGHRGTMFTLLTMNGESPEHYWTNIWPYYRPTAMLAKMQYLLTLQLSRNCILTFKIIVIQTIRQNKLDDLKKSQNTSWLLWEYGVQIACWLDKNSKGKYLLTKPAQNNKFKEPDSMC